MRHIIVGVDPGSTIGTAAVDLRGKLVGTSHTLGGGIEETISLIEKWGTPSLIAVDVKPAPSLALRIAASFNVPLFVPQRPWREAQKSALLKHLSVTVANAHERDALSAAIMAFRANQNTLGQTIALQGKVISFSPEQKDDLKHLILQGMRQTDAIQMIIGKSLPKQTAHVTQLPHAVQKIQPKPHIRDANPLKLVLAEKTIAELRKRVQFLENENENLVQKMRGLENGAKERVSRDLTVQKLRYEVMRLKNEIEQSRSMRKLQTKLKWQMERQQRMENERQQRMEKGRNKGGQGAIQPASLKALDEREGLLERMIREYRKGRPGN